MASDARRDGLLNLIKSGTPEEREKARDIFERLYDEAPPEEAAPTPKGPISDPAAAMAGKGVDWKKALSSAGNAVSDFVTGPLQAGVARWNDDVTMGYYPALVDALGFDTPQRRAKLATDYPTADKVGSGAAIATSMAVPLAPAAVVDRAVAQMAAPMVGRLKNPITKALGSIGTNAASGTVTGALEAVADGEAPSAGAVPGAIAGTVGGTIGQVMKAGAAGVRAASTHIRDYSNARRTGAYDAPELKAVEGIHGGLGVRRAAENAHDAIRAREADIVGNQKQQYREAIEPYLDTRLSRDEAQKQLLRQFSSNLDERTGKPIDKTLDAAYRQILEYLGGVKLSKPGVAPSSFSYDFAEEAPTLGQAGRKLDALRSEAAFESMAPTRSNVAAQKAYGGLKTAIDSSDLPPEALAARREAAANAAAARRRRDLIYNTENEVTRPSGAPAALSGSDSEISSMADALDADPTMRVAKEKAGATFLARVGDDNVPGDAANKYIQELADQDPEFARQIAAVRAKKAREAVRLSMQGLTPLSLTGATAGAGVLPFVSQNMRFLGARLAEPTLDIGGEMAARAGARGAGSPLLRDPIDAVMGRKRKKQEGKKE